MYLLARSWVCTLGLALVLLWGPRPIQAAASVQAAAPVATTAEGAYENLAEHWTGRYFLVRRGTTVEALLSTTRSPVQHYARQNPQVLFTVPVGFRPAQPVIWTVPGWPVDRQGRVQPVGSRLFDLQVTPDGAVRYVDNPKVEGVGNLRYATMLAWSTGAECGDSPLHGRTPEVVAAILPILSAIAACSPMGAPHCSRSLAQVFAM